VGIIANYGTQQIYAFGFLTNPLQYECSNDDESWFKCFSEDICSGEFDGTYRPDTAHKDYINGFMEQMDMVCFPKQSIAFIA
jgi:hypothetical protein